MVKKMAKNGTLPSIKVGVEYRFPVDAVVAARGGRPLPDRLESVALKAQVATLVKTEMDSVAAEVAARLDAQLAPLRRDLRELRHETHPKGAA